MRYRLLLILISISIMLGTDIKAAEQNDTIYNPTVVFTGMPKKYEIAGIRVTGLQNYEDYIVIGYSGLAVGDIIEIPGDEITNAAKRFWRQGLFSKIQIRVEKICGDKAWLLFDLRQQPRISQINYHGVKKSEREDIEERLNLMIGNQITQNIVNRAEEIISAYFKQKGFNNVEVDVRQTPDLSHENEMIVDIIIDKNEKIKVHKIHITGNHVLSDKKLQRVMKKTNEKKKLVNLFRQKKFVDKDFENDLDLIIKKYNELGYRDAKILKDSVVRYNEKYVDVFIEVEEGKQYFISDITWAGNTIYPSSMLDNILGMKKGDVYNQTLLNKRTLEDDDAVANLYMNKGYLFFQLIPIESKIEGDSIALEMRIMEGPQARINSIVINGNDRLYEKVIRRELRVRPGDLFSKDALQRSAREIAQTGHFDPESMDIRPEPNTENGTVDLIFNLTSKNSDQVELSAGWGQTGIIGKVALKFTNFSIKNLFNPKSYKGIIPQGEGQTFTISAQTNAKYYQAYSLSFLDPWFGGKRPNSLSVSAYYSRQTGVNSNFYNDNYYSGMLYNNLGSYWGSGYYPGYYPSYYDDYYQNSIENAYDRNKYLQMAGIAVGFGKRLNWPDNYFTFQAQLSYNWYHLKNWEYLYYMNNGTSNAFVLGLSFARNSIDNPIYTRSGSQFSIDLSLTPPVSLFSNKDWKALSEAGTQEAKEEMYRWIEYWKLKFKARTYTPLTDPEGKWTLVLMTRADIGLLGSYNKYLKSPFETFYVGGDGMSGSYGYAQETIALRGYDNGAFTPWTKDGYAYTRFCMELHFPFMLQPTTTIYGLAFLEGGNAWTDMKDFSPFNLKRSAGAGVRIYLPMVGMMGIDWAYGFDEVFGQKGGSHFHFILGQEF
ncbi:MAG: outer membrane protein assembly factor BamA [Bacteroidetes bacterium]|uniref:Outer membrane protein assembly factor BamA n=1 Tax=Candidatus Limisoma faecipullorum TaxID=2840854 RepID=A0A9D9INR1_9BACT|nr:outer membrane protein assembly factor BamA [Candidatus Limisoma faecipullorum]